MQAVLNPKSKILLARGYRPNKRENKETAIQNCAKFHWFKLNNVFFTWKAFYNVCLVQSSRLTVDKSQMVLL